MKIGAPKRNNLTAKDAESAEILLVSPCGLCALCGEKIAPASRAVGSIARPTKRHGNWTNRISGRLSHSGFEAGSAMKVSAITARAAAAIVARCSRLDARR